MQKKQRHKYITQNKILSVLYISELFELVNSYAMKKEQQLSESMEFRAFDEDAWYDVKLAINDEKLVVLYHDFPSEEEEFKAEDFNSIDDVKRLRERFRPLSQPLQDSECSKVSKGMIVCASHSFFNNDRQFCDAVVEQVLHKNHSFEFGDEQCTCKFLVYWTHGPGVGNQAIKSVESICLIQSGDQTDPTLDSFINTVTRKICGYPGYPHSFAEIDIPKLKVVENDKSEEEDTDTGSYHHVILIDNLEKDLSPLSVMEFIHEHTSIPTLACVFPSYSSEQYARAAIMLTSGKHQEPLLHFLDNPDHLIVSSKGRPWVISERMSRHAAFGTLMGPLMLRSQGQLDRRNFGSTDIKVVLSGTKEYDTAKQLKDLFCEFVDYQKGLHEKLASMEDELASC